MRASKWHAPVDGHRWRVDGGREHASATAAATATAVQAMLERRRRVGGGASVVRGGGGGGVDHGELLKVVAIRRAMQTTSSTKAFHVLTASAAAIEHARLEGHVVVVGLVLERLVQVFIAHVTVRRGRGVLAGNADGGRGGHVHVMLRSVRCHAMVVGSRT